MVIYGLALNKAGLNKYVPSENRFYHYKFSVNDSTTLSADYVISLFEDSFGNIWVGTVNGLNLLNEKKDTFKRFLYQPEGNAKDGTRHRNINNHNSVLQIIEDNTDCLWVATTAGLYKFGLNEINEGVLPQHYKVYRRNPLNTNSLSGNNIRTLYFDKYGILWIGVWGEGLNTFDPKTETFTRYNKNLVTGSLITSIYEDSGFKYKIMGRFL